MSNNDVSSKLSPGTAGTTQPAAREPVEPRQTYINDTLVTLDANFPGTNVADMPPDALDDAAEPELKPQRGEAE